MSFSSNEVMLRNQFHKSIAEIVTLSTLIMMSASCVQFHEMRADTDDSVTGSNGATDTSDSDEEYDTVSLLPPEGGDWLKRETNSYGIQGRYYLFSDHVFSEYDEKIPIPVKEGDEVVIRARGDVKREDRKDSQWGLGFGVTLCESDFDDFRTCESSWDVIDSDEHFFNDDSEKNSQIRQRWHSRIENLENQEHQYPFIRYYRYPLYWCPFNPSLSRQFKGIAFNLKGNFGKLEITFMQGNEIKWQNQPRCYVYEDENYMGGPDQSNAICEKDNRIFREGDTWKIRVFFDEIKIISDEIDVGQIRSIELGIKTYSGVENDDRPFDFEITNFKLLAQKDGNDTDGEKSLSTQFREKIYDTNTNTDAVLSDRCDTDDTDNVEACPNIDWVDFAEGQQILKTEVTLKQLVQYTNSHQDLIGNLRKEGIELIPDWPSCNHSLYFMYKADALKDAEQILEQSANCIDYNLAERFCTWIGGRLPTAEEWEKAARSGDSAQTNVEFEYPWGMESTTEAVGCDKALTANNCPPQTDEPPYVGCTAINGNTNQGVCDMAGNLAEWTSTSLSGTDFKIIKGGSFYMDNRDLTIDSCSMEYAGIPKFYDHLGVRCVR